MIISMHAEIVAILYLFTVKILKIEILFNLNIYSIKPHKPTINIILNDEN